MTLSSLSGTSIFLIKKVTQSRTEKTQRKYELVFPCLLCEALSRLCVALCYFSFFVPKLHH